MAGPAAASQVLRFFDSGSEHWGAVTSRQLPTAAGHGGEIVTLILGVAQLTDTGDSVGRDRLHLTDPPKSLATKRPSGSAPLYSLRLWKSPVCSQRASPSSGPQPGYFGA